MNYFQTGMRVIADKNGLKLGSNVRNIEIMAFQHFDNPGVIDCKDPPRDRSVVDQKK